MKQLRAGLLGAFALAEAALADRPAGAWDRISFGVDWVAQAEYSGY